MNHSPITAARTRAVAALLSARNAEGHWSGLLSSSALSTATAVCALAVFQRQSRTGRPELQRLINAGLAWLAAKANPDGGWGDTDRSFSNISTTTLVWAAFGVAGHLGSVEPHVIAKAEVWLASQAGGLEPAALATAIARRYGKDRTFSIPILAMAAIAGRLGKGAEAWRHVSQLPFELAALPSRWFGALRLPVVSYALPALIAIGLVRHHFRPTRNPVTRLLRTMANARAMRVLTSIQPANGGFLEATPLTSFVTISLAAMGATDHPVAIKGVEFLVRSARPDGSWAIDTNLSTWLTTLAVNALPAGEAFLSAGDRQQIRAWLLRQQFRARHPYTNAAPGGWAWTDQPGGVPDADDTAGALLALRRLGPADDASRQAAAAGARWLADLQNGDGGIPTFCKGWGTLPFDRSSPDITAHVLHAWVEWLEDLPPVQQNRIRQAIQRALGFLASAQRPDGAWIPLWFGNQEAPDDQNPLYGTARVLRALTALADRSGWPEAAAMAQRAERWLLATQKSDGGWAGALCAQASVEETALAVEALAKSGGRSSDLALRKALANGAHWLAERVASEAWREPSPIGFYFARLWYYDQLYPLIFAAGALSAAERVDGFQNPPSGR